MAGESTVVGAEAARAALEASASITGGALSVSLKIDSPIVAGVALAAGAAVTLGAFYLRYRWKTENAIRNSLERMNAIGAADPEVINIEEGSIIVKLRCHTPQSVLQFVKDFKGKKVKRRLEEELKKIGFDKELEVTIVNGQEVFQREQELRSLLEPQEDVKVTFEEVSLGEMKWREGEMKWREGEMKWREEPSKSMKEREKMLKEEEERLQERKKMLKERKKMLKEREERLQEREKRLKEREMSLEEREKRFEERMNFHGLTLGRSDPSRMRKGFTLGRSEREKRLEGAWKTPEEARKGQEEARKGQEEKRK